MVKEEGRPRFQCNATVVINKAECATEKNLLVLDLALARKSSKRPPPKAVIGEDDKTI